MLTAQTNIALQIVATLNGDEMTAFAREFEKMRNPLPTKPRLKKPEAKVITLPSTEVLAEIALARHQAKYSSASKLQSSLDVAG